MVLVVAAVLSVSDIVGLAAGSVFELALVFDGLMPCEEAFGAQVER